MVNLEFDCLKDTLKSESLSRQFPFGEMPNDVESVCALNLRLFQSILNKHFQIGLCPLSQSISE